MGGEKLVKIENKVKSFRFIFGCGYIFFKAQNISHHYLFKNHLLLCFQFSSLFDFCFVDF